MNLSALAKLLADAAADATPIPQLSDSHDIDVTKAYEIQTLVIARRLEHGESVSGIKLGFTSRAKMQQMNLDKMIWGRLTDAMLIEDGSSVALNRYIHPRAEPEIAFILKKPLSGPASPAQAVAAIEAIAPAIEVIDSRYENFRFSLADVIADNCSSAGYVLGGWHAADTDVANLGMVLQFNNSPVGIGSSAAILGHPLRSLCAASRLVAQHGSRLEAGWIVMAGSPLAAQYLSPGTHVRAEVQNLGSVEFLTR